MPFIFISYSHKDSEYANRLADSLVAKGLDVWIDERIDYGETWPRKIRENLDACSAFVVIMTNQAEESRWVQNELTRAQRLGKRIFPLLLEGDVWLALETDQYVDVRGAKLPPARFYKGLAGLLTAGQPSAAGTVGQRELAAPAPSQPAKPVEPAQPKLLIIDKPLRLELVRVPAGEFLMGSDPAKDKGAYDNEKPQHRLSLAEFYIGKYPVTVSHFAVFAQAQSYQTEAERDGWGWIWTGKEWKKENGASWSHPRGLKSDVAGKGDHPVTQVTWRDAQAFCLWVSKASGREIRLPSEAEWEKAARGVDGRVYPWGNEAPTAELCSFNMNVGDTTPVGHYPKGASPYGVLGMAGNVWEWTLSLWGKDASKPQFGYPYKPTDGREDLQTDVDISRVVRGGSCSSGIRLVRCAYRGYFNPSNRDSGFGFRVCAVIQQE